MSRKYNLVKPTKLSLLPIVQPPTKIDLTVTNKFPPVYDQGNLGSCTANSLLCAYLYDELNFNHISVNTEVFDPSRLYLYYQERVLEHDVPDDNGSSLDDGLLSLETKGVCSEGLWPYIVDKFKEIPPPTCDVDAKSHRVIQAKQLNQTLEDLQTCLRHSVPFVFGIACYNGLETLSAENHWILPIPSPEEKSIGGHAIICVGFDDTTKLFKIRNSWGFSFGDKGHFYIPYEYMLNPNLSYSFRVLSSVL